jgi:fatty-acid desaturase
MKNFFLTASSQKVFIFQTCITLSALIGIPFFEWGWTEFFVILLGHLLYGGIGISMTYHRYLSHKSFEFKYEWVRKLCLFLGIVSGRGSPIGWVYVHREHHAFADTKTDPHDPGTKGWRIFFHNIIDYAGTINKRWIKDLFNRTQLNINTYYMLYIYGYMLVLVCISPWLLYFFYIVPVTISAWSLNSFVYFSHVSGQRDHITRDNSKNNWVIALLLWGEGWHNNHHNRASSWNLQEKWYQLDPLSWIIRLVMKRQ